MNVIKAPTVRKAFEDLVNVILKEGTDIITEDNQRCRELYNVLVEITNPNISFLNPKYTMKLKCVNEYINNLVFEDTIKNDFVYTYFGRIHNYEGFEIYSGHVMAGRHIISKLINQKEYVINKLNNSPTTRRAIINIWNPSTDILCNHTPCLQQIFFQKRGNKLYMTVVFRSNDAFVAFHSNALGLIAFGNEIAKSTNTKLVNYTHFIYNAHIYIDRDKSELQKHFKVIL